MIIIMKRLITSLCLTISLALGSFGLVWSDGLQRGYEAAQRGDYATALKEWTPLANQGDGNAQYNLGIIFSYGHGVPKDQKAGIKWYTVSAVQGYLYSQFNLGSIYGQVLFPFFR